MTFLQENFEVIVILLFIVSIVLSALILSLNKYFAMYFSNKKFEIISSADINALDGKNLLSKSLIKILMILEYPDLVMYIKVKTSIFIKVI